MTVAHVRQLHSADNQALVVCDTRSSFSASTFATSALLIWNSLLPNLKKNQASTVFIGV